MKETLLCHAIIGRSGGRELVKKVRIVCEFIDPLLQFSTESICFTVHKVVTYRVMLNCTVHKVVTYRVVTLNCTVHKVVTYRVVTLNCTVHKVVTYRVILNCCDNDVDYVMILLMMMMMMMIVTQILVKQCSRLFELRRSIACREFQYIFVMYLLWF